MSRRLTTPAISITTDLAWVDMVKAIAIVGVFLDNWNSYFELHFPGWGPFVQVFFILSGFGLTLAYLNGKASWNWKQWTWRRITKTVVPYFIAVIFSFALGIMGSYLYPSIVGVEFSWEALLAYLTLTRNFFPTTWAWNPPLWFMPVIIGLYIIFPVLLKILERWGLWVLLIISVFLTYGAITIALFINAPRGHGADLFLDWTMQFSLGMVLAYVRSSQPKQLQKLVGLKAALIGIGFFAFSWALRTYIPLGREFNDIFSSVGIFLILLNLSWLLRLKVPATKRFLGTLASQSYLMYLIHWPIMAFLFGPLLNYHIASEFILEALCVPYIVVVFFLCLFISQPINNLTSWLYRLFFPVYQRPIPSRQST